MSLFITFEGPDGSGKSTVIEAVSKQLNVPNILTREPGGIEVSEAIREIILGDYEAIDARTEALLFAASRREHLVKKVLPALNAGKIVLCDRFIDSSLAYQGYARGLGMDLIQEVNEFAIASHYPDLTLYFKVPAEIGLSRIMNNNRTANRLDKETLSFHQKVSEGYDILASKYSRIVTIDATQPLEKVIEQAIDVINKRLKEI